MEEQLDEAAAKASTQTLVGQLDEASAKAQAPVGRQQELYLDVSSALISACRLSDQAATQEWQPFVLRQERAVCLHA